MSNYINAVRSERPDHLYVFDNLTSVNDLGRVGINLSIISDVGEAEIELRPALVEGLVYSLHPTVRHDSSVGNASQYRSFFQMPSRGSDFFGPDTLKKWSAEFLIHPRKFNRAGTNTGCLLGVAQTGISGLFINFDDSQNWTFSFRQDYEGELGKVIAETPTYTESKTYHVVFVNTATKFSIYVDGKIVSRESVSKKLDPIAVSNEEVRIGGYDSFYHSDTTIQSLAIFSDQPNSRKVLQRTNLIQYSPSYSITVVATEPDITVLSDLSSTGTKEPELEPLATGTNSDDIYEDGTESIEIQDSALSGATTVSKYLEFDVSELTAGIRSYLDIQATVGGSSSVAVYYKLDDGAYILWQEGNENIDEINGIWGGAE